MNDLDRAIRYAKMAAICATIAVIANIITLIIKLSR